MNHCRDCGKAIGRAVRCNPCAIAARIARDAARPSCVDCGGPKGRLKGPRCSACRRALRDRRAVVAASRRPCEVCRIPIRAGRRRCIECASVVRPAELPYCPRCHDLPWRRGEVHGQIVSDRCECCGLPRFAEQIAPIAIECRSALASLCAAE